MSPATGATKSASPVPKSTNHAASAISACAVDVQKNARPDGVPANASVSMNGGAALPSWTNVCNSFTLGTRQVCPPILIVEQCSCASSNMNTSSLAVRCHTSPVPVSVTV